MSRQGIRILGTISRRTLSSLSKYHKFHTSHISHTSHFPFHSFNYYDILCNQQLKTHFWKNLLHVSFAFRSFASNPLPGGGVPIEMPALSPTMQKGNIIEWTKKEGDKLEPGDVLCEVETDKATLPFEIQEEGYLAKILKPNGSNDIDVGSAVAILVENQDDLAAYKDYKPELSMQSEKPVKTEVVESVGKSLPPHIALEFPSLSPTMTRGNLINWEKKEGDEVKAGDVLCNVETDKATLPWESQDDGYLAKILFPDESPDIDVNTKVAILVDDPSLISAFANLKSEDLNKATTTTTAPDNVKAEEKPKVTTKSPSSKQQKEIKITSPPLKSTKLSSSVSDSSRINASPYAKKLALESGISLIGLTGTGFNGRIIAEDVQNLINSGKGAPAAPPYVTKLHLKEYAEYNVEESYIDIPHTQIRRVTASRLLQSKQTVPHYYLTSEIQMDELMSARKQLNQTLESQNPGNKISVNDFVIKAAALALKSVPEVNSTWHDDFIRQYNNVDISIAVQTPVGLMVPIIKNADIKGLLHISSNVKSLAAKAKDGRLKPEEFTGGTFTISNLGMYGISSFCAIINPPQSGTLAVGATLPHVIQDPITKSFKQIHIMRATLSCDHKYF